MGTPRAEECLQARLKACIRRNPGAVAGISLRPALYLEGVKETCWPAKQYQVLPTTVRHTRLNDRRLRERGENKRTRGGMDARGYAPGAGRKRSRISSVQK